MATAKHNEEALFEKIRALPKGRRVEVEDFVDFLRVRDEERGLGRIAARLSEKSFGRIWDNEGDAEYDRI